MFVVGDRVEHITTGCKGEVVDLESWIPGFIIVQFEGREANQHNSNPQHCHADALVRLI